MLFIRTDGNSEIGTGHIMRCLSIAQSARRIGRNCIFITANKEMEALLAEQGFPIICLNSTWNDLDDETGKMEAIIREHKIDRLLIDSYFVTEDYLRKLQELTTVAYIDDLNAFHYPCDLLINYNIYADKFDYPACYPTTKLLLGCKYAPLREEFQNLPQRIVRGLVKSVLVTTGGSDPYNVAGRLAERAKKTADLRHLEYHIVAGRFNPHLPDLMRLAEEFPGIIVHSDVRNMSQLMLDCDIAVSAAGSTLYELCACGVPSTIFALADNQLDGISAFSEGFMLGAGDFRKNANVCVDNLLSNVARLAEDFELRRALSTRNRALIDGQGTVRICQEFFHLTTRGR